MMKKLLFPLLLLTTNICAASDYWTNPGQSSLSAGFGIGMMRQQETLTLSFQYDRMLGAKGRWAFVLPVIGANTGFGNFNKAYHKPYSNTRTIFLAPGVRFRALGNIRSSLGITPSFGIGYNRWQRVSYPNDKKFVVSDAGMFLAPGVELSFRTTRRKVPLFNPYFKAAYILSGAGPDINLKKTKRDYYEAGIRFGFCW